MRPVITLLSDFGTADGYVAEMKGVLLAQVPEAQLVDMTHEIPPHDVEAGRLALARYWRRFPPGTVHLAVVDPTVGTDRDALAVATEGLALVGPDNGLLSPALLTAGARTVVLPVPAGASPTFHGRDVFAPAAAMLAQGVAIDSLGAPASEPLIRRTPEPSRRPDGSIVGEVITVDRFGNAITNLISHRDGVVEVGGRRLPLTRTYSDVRRGEPVALIGSSGLIEIGIRDGNASASLGLERGTLVVLRV